VEAASCRWQRRQDNGTALRERRTIEAMNLSNAVTVAVVALVGLVGVAACHSEKENAERTAACTDRVNGVSCNACCGTENYAFQDKKCVCKGDVVAPKAK
jgi:hypothetical protein